MTKFRATKGYERHWDKFGDALKFFYQAKDDAKQDGLITYEQRLTCEGYTIALETIVLTCYNWIKYIREQNKEIAGLHIAQPWTTRPLDTAIMEAVSILDEPIEYCVPLKHEVDALEILSYSAYRELKSAGKANYCKYCNSVLDDPCKKHKPASSVEGMFYCKMCHGFMEKLCATHPEDSI